ncbi:uncharacterized protein LOC126844805 [Adelges cooleyi]|uniref:uncharacterized protein LOC126844805 n=1 Tax=Adelges cooleyi TaxID=133065 RepID=UPI00217F9C60|nr:uncharacterized protein LOC126844805 [Adelges cooleyi]
MSLVNCVDSQNNLSVLGEDEYLSQFTVLNDKSKGICSLLSVDEQLKKLNKGLMHMETLICHQVYKNHEDLLNQVTWIENLEIIINEISLQLQNLQSLVELLKSRITELFLKVQTQVVILNRLHATCDLLRKITRTQSITLQAMDKENIISPNIIFEIKELIEDKDLKSITFLSKDLIKLRNIYEKINKYSV